jgi:serine protease Do
MEFKTHHKIMIGSFTSIVIIFMVISGILLNIVLTRQNLNYNSLNNKIDNLQADTQSKLNDLTQAIMQTQNNISSISNEVGSIGQQFNTLKASAGDDFSGIIEDAVKSVVTVKTDVAQGTGFIIDKDGYVVTNAHVLSGGKTVEAIDYQQNTIPAQFIGYDANLDIALLKIPVTNDRLKLANSDDVQIGEKVIAIGNPLGLQFSVSQGIVSAVNREGSNGLDAYIQTDAALNPGNSGGPLINTDGEVIGINNFKIGGSENLGFALESNYIKEAVDEISQQQLNETLLA